jgi:nucleoside-diphosphate-sugar epimerase
LICITSNCSIITRIIIANETTGIRDRSPVRNNETVKLFPTNPRRDFIYVDDVISANVHAFSNFDALDKRYYEVGSGEDNLFESALDYAGIDFEYHDATAIPDGYQFYTKSIPSNWMSGWKPQFDLESGIRSYIEYLVSSDE